MKAILNAAALLVGLTVVAGLIVVSYVVSVGLSARAQPGRAEEFVARTVRGMAVARQARGRMNPIAESKEALADGRGHFADHCASCHANDGSGNTEMGRNLFPKAPDMRQARTQNLSDGELFWIIENGVRFTGMPGWGNGTAAGERSSWHLVHFIRRLPKLTPEDMEEMEALNPKPPAEVRQQIEEERFLQGGEVTPARPPSRSREHAEENSHE